MWAKFDAAQLRGWQYAVDFYGRHTGQTQFNIVRLMLVVYVAAVGTLWMEAATSAQKIAAGIFIVAVLIVTPFGFWLVWYIETNVARGKPNPEKISGSSRFNRVIQTLLALNTAMACLLKGSVSPSDLTSSALWVAFHLLACDVPPPPQERESVDNMVTNGA